jgi:pimeloyl-ACP methyl ester carboxylesterase
MPKVYADGVNLFYRQAGRGPDVILVHGLAANLSSWYFRITPPLAQHYRVTAYDLRGHGLSDMPPTGYTSAEMANDMRGLLDALSIRRAHLVGHSFGGLVALHFTALFPERVETLTIADSRVGALQPVPKLRDWPQWQAWKRRAKRFGITPDDDQHLDHRLLEWLALHGRSGRHMRTSFFLPFDNGNGGRRVALQWLRLLGNTTARSDFGAEAGMTLAAIQRVDQPTRAIFGAYSFCLPTCRALQEQMPRCDAVIIPRVGHFHPIVRPIAFLRHLRGFLAAAERSRN